MNKVEKYINQATWLVKENANAGYSFSGLQLFLAENGIKEYMLNQVYNKNITKAHEQGYMYIHDLGMGLTVYCLGHDLKTLLRRGVNGVPGKIETSPPKHLRSAVNHMINYLFANQSDSAGANAFSNVDTLLAPFIRKENLDYKEVKQCVQEFIYGMNMPFRVGFQSVFSNVTFDIKCPSMFKDEHPIINGEKQDFTYGDLNEEIGMVAKAFFEIMMEGDKKGQPFTFPIPTINLHKNFVWDDDIAKVIFEATAKYGTPSFQNFINSDLNPDDTYSMCPLTGDTEVLVNTSKGNKIMPIYQLFHNQNKGALYKTLFNGQWNKSLVTEQGEQNIYQVVTYNGDTIKFGEDHLQPVYGKGTVKVKDIKVGDYLPYNTTGYDGELGDYDLGYAIGMYAGDGSKDKGGITFSLNKNTDVEANEKIVNYFKKLGFSYKTTISDELLTTIINGKEAVNFIERYITGTSLTKKFNQRIFDMSKEARQGILDGWYQSDGGNSGRIYTFSEELAKQFETVCTSLGQVAKLDYIDQRDGRLSNNPCYVIKSIKANKYRQGFFTENGIKYIRVEKITKTKPQNVYCFNVDNEERLFTLASGLTTHNCRLRLDKRKLVKGTGGIFGAGASTGSIGVVTINLPMIGYEASQEHYNQEAKKYDADIETIKQTFFKKLEKYMESGKESLEIKRTLIEQNLKNGMMPYIQAYIENFDNHFSTIATIGGNELCKNLIGKDLTHKKSQMFIEEVLDFMKGKIEDYQEETGNYYNLEQAPAEGASYKLALKSKEKYPNIKLAGTEETPYMTNSTHLPVDKTEDILSTLQIQERFNEKYNGGTIAHVYLGEKVTDWINCMLLVKKIASNTTLPFFSITPSFSICPVHGYISGEHQFCPLDHSEDQLDEFGVMIGTEEK